MLLELLHRVAAHAGANGMDAGALGEVFAPCIAWQPPPPKKVPHLRVRLRVRVRDRPPTHIPCRGTSVDADVQRKVYAPCMAWQPLPPMEVPWLLPARGGRVFSPTNPFVPYRPRSPLWFLLCWYYLLKCQKAGSESVPARGKHWTHTKIPPAAWAACASNSSHAPMAPLLPQHDHVTPFRATPWWRAPRGGAAALPSRRRPSLRLRRRWPRRSPRPQQPTAQSSTRGRCLD